MTTDQEIRQPRAGKKRAFVVIDAQPATLTSDEARETLKRIAAYIRQTDYDAYIVATYFAPEDSMFARQGKWLLPDTVAGPSDAAIAAAIREKGKPEMEMRKTVRSIFKPVGSSEVKAFLDLHGIDELHISGFDVNDCVLATAYDALDLGYFSYIIEECCGRTDSNRPVIDAALTVLRRQGMTNNSNRLEWVSVTI